jgi:hypothetical protein
VCSVAAVACFLEYPEQPNPSGDDEEARAALLYRHRKTYAVGHGAAADWIEQPERRASQVQTTALPQHDIKPIVPTQFQDIDLAMKGLAEKGKEADARAVLSGLCNRYSEWIAERITEVASADFPTQHRLAAQSNLEHCRACLKRMQAGITLLERNRYAMTAFRLMNKTMLEQQLHFGLPLRE